MSENASQVQSIEQVEEVLCEELAHGDAVLASARPVLVHLLHSAGQELFSDEILAKIRGMAKHCAEQLLQAGSSDSQQAPLPQTHRPLVGQLTTGILEDPAFLAHAHALAIESLIAAKLSERSGFNPVLSPLIQEVAASPNEELAAGAIHILAAQARFVQQQRRMELPLNELPGDLLHKMLLILRSFAGVDSAEVDQAEARIRSGFDESRSRVGQITRLIMALDRKAMRALSIDHAGLAIFVTALGMASSQDRNLAVMSLGEDQLSRFALSLRAAGLAQSVVEEQFMFLHPEITLPPGFDGLSASRAAALLADSPETTGG